MFVPTTRLKNVQVVSMRARGDVGEWIRYQEGEVVDKEGERITSC